MLEQKVRCRCVLALTATATKATEADVTQVLKIHAHNVVRDSTVRDNLRLSVTHFNGGLAIFRLLLLLAECHCVLTVQSELCILVHESCSQSQDALYCTPVHDD